MKADIVEYYCFARCPICSEKIPVMAGEMADCECHCVECGVDFEIDPHEFDGFDYEQ